MLQFLLLLSLTPGLLAVRRKQGVILCGAALVLLTGGCGSGLRTDAVPAVRNFDAARYMGVWYEVARLPHSFERGLTDCSATYTLQPDGRVAVVNTGMKAGRRKSVKGRAVFKGPSDVGELRVSFFGPFYGDYRILFLEEDYSVSLVTSSTFDYFWILARTQRLPDTQLKRYLELAASWGIDISRLEYPWVTSG